MGGNAAELKLFTGEIRTLFLIMLMFTSTYLARALWDAFQQPTGTSFESMAGSIWLSLAFDFFPVSLLMYLHYRNFTVKSEAQ